MPFINLLALATRLLIAIFWNGFINFKMEILKTGFQDELVEATD